MPHVTLIGEKLAKEGLEFAFGGCLPGCQSCEIKNSCCGLEKNKWYRITEVRDMSHECQIHVDNVRVVEVEEIPLKTAVKGRGLIEGSVITLENKNCREVECRYFQLCNPPGIETGGKYHVEKIGKKLECAKGYDLKEVELE